MRNIFKSGDYVKWGKPLKVGKILIRVPPGVSPAIALAKAGIDPDNFNCERVALYGHVRAETSYLVESVPLPGRSSKPALYWPFPNKLTYSTPKKFAVKGAQAQELVRLGGFRGTPEQIEQLNEVLKQTNADSAQQWFWSQVEIAYRHIAAEAR